MGDLLEKVLALINSDSSKPGDVIVILEGDGLHRVFKGCELYNEGLAQNLLYSGGLLNVEKGSLPFNFTKNTLKSCGIAPESVIVDEKSMNTRDQAENVIDLCLSNSWHTLLLVASHYHQCRAFLTFLKVLHEKGLENKIQIINTPATTPRWFVDEGWGKRFDLLQSEHLKIAEYQQTGHVSSFEEAIEYYKWRESI